MAVLGTEQEAEWIRLSQSGDTQAFGRLVAGTRPFVLSLAYRLCGNAHEAEDVAQEAFVRAWQALPRFRGDASFRSWMYRITTNVALDHLRATRPTESIDDNPIPNLNTPESQTLRAERQHAVRRAIARLPADTRAVLVLREYEGLSYKEIAATLELPLGTVMSRLHYARRWLCQQLEHEWQHPLVEVRS